MTIFSRNVMLGLPILLAGCVNYSDITTAPQNVQFTSNIAASNVAQTQEIEVRTLTVSGKEESEVLGAVCQLKGTGFRASVKSPAKVVVPTYLGKTDPISITCSNGKEAKTQVIEAINITAQQSSVGTGNLVADLIVIAAEAAIKSQRDTTKDRFSYPGRFVVRFGETAE